MKYKYAMGQMLFFARSTTDSRFPALPEWMGITGTVSWRGTWMGKPMYSLDYGEDGHLAGIFEEELEPHGKEEKEQGRA